MTALQWHRMVAAHFTPLQMTKRLQYFESFIHKVIFSIARDAIVPNMQKARRSREQDEQFN